MNQILRHKVTVLALILTFGLALSAQASDPEMTAFLDDFFKAYETLDHLDYYADDVLFEDPTARLRMEGKGRLQSMVDQFKGFYHDIKWVRDRQFTNGKNVAVEGHVSGKFQDKVFEVRFATFLTVENKKIVHQIDYVDYETFKKQTQLTE